MATSSASKKTNVIVWVGLIVFVLLISVFLSRGCVGEKKLTEEEFLKKFQSEKIVALERELVVLRDKLTVAQVDVSSGKSEIAGLELDNFKKISEIALKDKAIAEWVAKKKELEARENEVSRKEILVEARYEAVAQLKEEAEGKVSSVKEVSQMLVNFLEEMKEEKNELALKEESLRREQETFLVLKNGPNTPFNRERISDQGALVRKLSEDFYVARRQYDINLSERLEKTRSLLDK